MKILSNSKYERLLQYKQTLGEILDSVAWMLRGSDRCHYQYNEPGSGDVQYTRDGAEHCNEKDIEFNQYPSEFKGFYIDNQRVQLSDIVKLLNLP